MGQRIHIRAALGLAFLGLALIGPPGPASAAAAPAKTAVTIKNTLPRLYGYVRSATPARCSANRLVVVIKVRKDGPDRVAGEVKTRKFRTSWQWSLPKPTGKGTFYAKTGPRPGCGGGTTRTVEPGPPIRGDDMPDCGQTSGNMCKIATKEDRLMFITDILETCPNFGRSSGSCDGKGQYGVAPLLGDSNFHWNENGRGPFRGVAYYTTRGSHLEGSTPNSASDRFSIREGRLVNDTDRTWCTADLPGIPAGQPGGPININFFNQEIGAKVFFWGVLQRKSSVPGEC